MISRMKLKFLISLLLVSLFPLLAFAERGEVHKRIIDGSLRPATDFPMVAKLYIGDSICTGTLVGARHVLTAAHCFYDDDSKVIKNPDVMEVYLNNVFYPAKKATIHPSYKPRNSACIDNEVDAAVIELSQDVSGITPVPLIRGVPAVGTGILLVGFGTQGNGSRGEDGTLPSDGFLNIGYTSIERIQSSLYLAWDFEPGESNTASGDSGGPAFVDFDGVRYISSITCGGDDKAQFGTESINTRADAIASWVDSVINGGGSGTPGGGFSVSRAKIDFGDNNNYTFLLKGNLGVGSGFKPKNKKLIIELPGYSDSFKLSSSGNAYRKNGYDYVELSGKMTKGAYKNSTVKFSIGLVDKSKLYNALDNFFPVDPSSGAELPVTIKLNGITYSATISMHSQKNGDRWTK